MNVCKAIQCPYFNAKTNNYGCQRYQVSNHCHLIKDFQFLAPTQYVLVCQETTELDKIKSVNKEYFLTDEKYQDDKKFLETHSGWFNAHSFKVGNLI
ncbi:hypothetical protein NIES2100_05600 [Calothrix sp. NIES-2100]|uniref:hypothetical protein n=1 Tax=Calothrix sp. NIES-2100 TaxID=1954172 RepID=UPI000B610588|nr:hypothetical protein NIES2100_05600 [Calothrix sp. NIES-2100]